jgi:hypothetical protein
MNPKSDAKSAFWHFAFLPKADKIAAQQKQTLFDHLIGDPLKMQQHVEAQRSDEACAGTAAIAAEKGLSSRQTKYVVEDLEIGQPINSAECSETAGGVACGEFARKIDKSSNKKLASMLCREYICIEVGNPLLTLLRGSKVA